MTKEIKIALVAILAIVLCFFGLNFLKGISLFSSEDSYYIEFENVSGLNNSTPIYANGYFVGAVKHINFDFDKKNVIRVEAGLDKKMRVPEGTVAEIESDLMGNVQLNLIMGDGPAIIAPGGTFKGMINEGTTGKLAAMVPSIEKMLPKLDSIMGSLNTILADPSIVQSLHNVQNVSSRLITASDQLNSVMAGLNKTMPGLLQNASGTLDNARTLTARLNTQLNAVDVAKTMQQVDNTLANVQALTDKLNSGEGSLGLLMNDPTLYTNLNATVNSLNTTVRNADSLVVNLREHPKRYVHFSVFGKKDK